MILRAVGSMIPDNSPNILSAVDWNDAANTFGVSYNSEIAKSTAAPWVLGVALFWLFTTQ